MKYFSLKMEGQEQIQMQITTIDPNRCHICPLTQDTAPRIPAENIPWMYLQCGHRIHTNCFLERSNDHYMRLIRFSCPVCQEHALTNNMIQWIEAQEQHDFIRADTLQTLWNENHEFREDIKNLSKIQRVNSSVISNHKKECIELRNQWNREIHTSMEFIRMKRKEYYRLLKSLPFRKKALYGINTILRMRNSLIRKYPSLNWYHYSIISHIPGAPKLKRYSRMSAWLFSGSRIFNLRRMKI